MNGFRGALLKPSEKGERRPTASRSIAKGSRFEILKDKIRTWWDDRFKIGEYLREIRDTKLYLSEYKTFEEFCEAEFEIQRAYAYRLIEAASVKASVAMSPIGDKLKTEGQARALAPVPVEQREEVLVKVVEQGPVTAKAITAVAQTVAPRPATAPAKKTEAVPAKEIHLDKTGYPIPESILADWQRAEAFGAELREVSRIKGVVEKGIEQKDVIFAEITNTTIAAIKNMRSDLKRVLPHSVCTSCQGRNPKRCTLCKGRGFVSQFTYDTCIPMETKSLRERAVKK